MTLLDAPAPPAPAFEENGRVPPLENGDRLTGEEFMRRYKAMPDVKAELVQGIVYMASPVRLRRHGRPVRLLSTWLGTYESMHPHVVGADDTSVFLTPDDKVQPDLLLMLPPERGGKAYIGEDDYVHGPPELVVEVAASTATLDAGNKAESYHVAGVPEYLLWRTQEKRVDWYVHDPAGYRPINAGADGILESRIFRGLRLDRQALLRGDLAAVLRAVAP